MPIIGQNIGAGVFQTLGSYLSDVRRYLKDPNGALYSDSDLTSFINRAIQQRDMQLRCMRIRLSVTLVSGQFDYPFSTIAQGTLLDGPATGVLYDVVSIIVIPLGSASSSVRYPLDRKPFSWETFLLSTSFPTYPKFYALYGPTNVMLGPPPAGNYNSEFDMAAYSPGLVLTTDTDLMPYPYSDPVPFLAAAFGKQRAQRFDEADSFEKQYDKRLNWVRATVRLSGVANSMSDMPRR